MTNAALIAKLLKAEEGSRALSDEVLLALGSKLIRENDGLQLSKDGRIFAIRLDPTSNLQDAVDLAPEGLYWSIGWHTSTGDLLAKAVLWPPGPGPEPNEGWRGRHIEPAMSFCIAILKAMETESAGG